MIVLLIELNSRWNLENSLHIYIAYLDSVLCYSHYLDVTELLKKYNHNFSWTDTCR